MRRFTFPIACLVVFATASIAVAQQPVSGGTARYPQEIPGQFIVELHPGAAQDAVLRAHGLVPLARWRIVNGFVARMSDAAASRLFADPSVKSVRPDLVVEAFARPAPGGGGAPTECPDGSGAMTTPQQIPTGVQRIGAVGGTTGLGVKVAVIDTGIDNCHPDLKDNVKGGRTSSTPASSPRDDNGHGTHVAGTSGALDNEFGVVGIAPETSLYAVKVLNSKGSGTLSGVITGIDWSAQNGMQVANLSLGALDTWCYYFGLCGLGAECTAVTNAAAAGVTVVVAAGNEKDEAVYYTPGNCVDSVTVTAHVDSDGASGGLGPSFTIDGQLEADDTFAQSFSNFSQFGSDIDGSGAIDSIEDHPVVDLTAPGVAILSTMPIYRVTLNKQYKVPMNYGVLSGTSMSTAHASGAAVRYIATHPFATPDEVRKGLVLGGECPTGKPEWLICATKWPDDPDPDVGSEPLVRGGVVP